MNRPGRPSVTGTHAVPGTSARPARGSRPRVSVLIVTWRRPGYVRSCLEHVAALDVRAHEVIVVDASLDDLTAAVIDDFTWATHLRFPGGAGHMTTSRNLGLLHATGDIIAFIDDDANVRAGWMNALLDAFSDPAVGAVAGRTCNGHPGEESEGMTAIGLVLPNGDLTGNFAADSGAVIRVHHGIGANMSFRREVLAELGGFRDDFGGVGGVREDADVFLRASGLGFHVVFCPDAVVDHIGAPHAKGQRFDYRYTFWAAHNHALLLARNFGLGSSYFRGWVGTELLRTGGSSQSTPLRRAVRAAIKASGVLAGIVVSLRKASWNTGDPVRRDLIGERIRRHLSGVGEDPRS